MNTFESSVKRHNSTLYTINGTRKIIVKYCKKTITIDIMVHCVITFNTFISKALYFQSPVLNKTSIRRLLSVEQELLTNQKL